MHPSLSLQGALDKGFKAEVLRHAPSCCRFLAVPSHLHLIAFLMRPALFSYTLQGALDKGFKAEVLRRCAELLRRRYVARQYSIQYVLHARVPIIKFKDAQHGVCGLVGRVEKFRVG